MKKRTRVNLETKVANQAKKLTEAQESVVYWKNASENLERELRTAGRDSEDLQLELLEAKTRIGELERQ